MRKLLIALLLFATATAIAQPTNYTRVAGRYRWTSGYFDSTMHIPSGPTPKLGGGYTGPGALFFNTTDSSVYTWTGTQWTLLRGSIEGEVSTVRNNTGSTINKGSVVYITGSTGTVPTIAKASAKRESTSAVTFGVLAQDLANGETGYAVLSGRLYGLNTNAYTEGAAVYLDTIAGQFTHTKYQAPNHFVLIGYIVKKSGGNGSLEVKIQNYPELDELHNVQIINPTNGQGLVYSSSDSLWKNQTISTDNIYTANGTLTGNRVVSYGGNTLKFAGVLRNDSSYIQTPSIYGLQIGFNDGTNTPTTKSNISITNSGTGGVGYPQAFPIMTGKRNIYMIGTDIPGGTGSTTISGDDNLILGRPSIFNPFSGSGNTLIYSKGTISTGSGNTGLGLAALNGITTGSNNLHLTIGAGFGNGAFTSSLSNSIYIGDPVKTNNNTTVAGDIVIATPYTATTQFWFGGKSDASDIYFNIPVKTGTNQTGWDQYWRSSIGTGTGQPGKIFFQHSTPTSSGTTIQSSFTNTLSLERTKIYTDASVNTILGGSTDAGYRLDIQGTGRFKGDLTLDGDGSGAYSRILAYTNGSSPTARQIIHDPSWFTMTMQSYYGLRLRMGRSVGVIVENDSSIAYGGAYININPHFNSSTQRITFFKGKGSYIDGTNTKMVLSTGFDGSSNTTGQPIEIIPAAGYDQWGPANSKGGDIYLRGGDVIGDYANKQINSGNVFVNDTQGGSLIVGATTDDESAKLAVYSTNRGFLMPRMTTTQMNGIGRYITSLSTLVGGSGYTNGTYQSVPLTGGTGSGAFAVITISGGAVTNVALYTPGNGYVVGDVLSASNTNLGGTGAGFTITVASISGPTTGLQVFNTVDSSIYVYRGTTSGWQSLASGANFYTTDGTLTGNRTVTMGGKYLDIVGSSFTNRWSSAGRLLLGNPTESIYLLDVNGNSRFNTDLLVGNNITVGRGNNTVAFNTAFGTAVLQNNSSSGNWNTGFGYQALNANVSGNFNTAIGQQALLNSTGSHNTGISNAALIYMTSGSNNIALGSNAGAKISGGITNLTTSNNSIFIGYNSFPLADNQTNQIVLGYGSVGLGSNTMMLGNSSILTTAIYGNTIIGGTTDVGYKLDVQGTGRFTGAVEGSSFNSIATSSRGGYSINYATASYLIFGQFFTNTGSTRTNAIISRTTDYGVSNANLLNLFSDNTFQFDDATAYQGQPTQTSASAFVEIKSTTKGFLPPRMTNTQMTAITTPATGLQVFNTTDSSMYVYRGSGGGWASMGSGGINGLYTPTATNVLNVTTASPYQCSYTRIGDVVTVSGVIDLRCAVAGTPMQVGLSLPIPSNFTATGTNFRLSGVLNHYAQTGGTIYSDITNDRAELIVNFNNSSTTYTCYFTFTYKIF